MKSLLNILGIVPELGNSVACCRNYQKAGVKEANMSHRCFHSSLRALGNIEGY